MTKSKNKRSNQLLHSNEPLKKNEETMMKKAPFLKLTLVILLLVVLLLPEVCPRRGKGSRRRKMGKQNAKVVFNTNPKRAEYYNNVNVSSL